MRDHATFSRRRLLAALGLFPAARLLRGWQQTEPPQQPNATFSTNVKVVNVFATVRDKVGHVVNDLTQSDFQLAGRAQFVIWNYACHPVGFPEKDKVAADYPHYVRDI